MRDYGFYGSDAMTNHPRRLLLAGLLVGGLGIAGYAVRSGNGEFPSAFSGFGGHDASIATALDAPSSKASGSGSVAPDGISDNAVEQILQAIRDSLQRNDLASARSLLNAVQVFGKDDKQVLSLQKDLQAREKKSDDAPRVPEPEPGAAPEPAQLVSGPIAKSERVRGSSSSVRERATTKVHHSRGGHVPQDKAVTSRPMDVDAASTGSLKDETTQSPVTAAASLPSDPPVKPAIPSPVAPPAQSAPDTQKATIQTAQPPQPRPISTLTEQGPKTRAQVRAELERARDSGELPRFGNPDPAGPGRTPSSPDKSAAVTGHE
jgi:Domain of unknown function (DUF4148)